MNNINKTLYIPLYGKAMVSKKRIILNDRKAEEISASACTSIKGKSKSKWLAYFMAMRARVFDEWTRAKLINSPDTVVLHIGCGLDSRALRMGELKNLWYDVDLPDVVEERRKYFSEDRNYKMLCGNAAEPSFLDALPQSKRAVVVMEGISMYLENSDIIRLFLALQKKFETVNILMDVYTVFGAKATKFKNPINDVGVTEVYGVDNAGFALVNAGIEFVGEHNMTPKKLVNELKSGEKAFFSIVFAGKAARKIYRLFEYKITRK